MAKVPSLDPVFHSTTVNTNPDRLGLVDDSDSHDRRDSASPGRVKRFGAAVVDKLSRSKQTLSPPGSPSGHRRVLSRGSLKGKSREDGAVSLWLCGAPMSLTMRQTALHFPARLRHPHRAQRPPESHQMTIHRLSPQSLPRRMPQGHLWRIGAARGRCESAPRH